MKPEYGRVVVGNLLIDQYGNILKVTKRFWDGGAKRVHYYVEVIYKYVDVFGFVTSDDFKRGRVRKATKRDIELSDILYARDVD